MSETPKGFDDLKPAELYRSALEDFALPVEEADKGKKKVLLAAFVEGGVEWADYVAQHPEIAPAVEEVKAPRAGEVVTSDAPSHNSVETAPGPVEPENKWADDERAINVQQQPRIVVQEPIAVNTPDQYLIKMVRDNPLFEIRGHKFTTQHPYALVGAADADYILKEDGFRQATPAELREFYG